MKLTCITLLSAVALLLGGCASPRTAEISEGKIKNITSAEATTLAKADFRQKKVADVLKNAPPLVRFEAHDGQPITINAKVFEVNAPMDIRELLAEQASEVSENVQVLDRAVRLGERVVAPMAAIGFAADVAKRKSDNARAVALDYNATRRAEIAADAALNADLVEAAQKDPLVIEVPLGSSVLSGGAEAATPAGTTP
jgi:cell division protein ZapA (FtsZ GTPase activity inhibitor)